MMSVKWDQVCSPGFTHNLGMRWLVVLGIVILDLDMYNLNQERVGLWLDGYNKGIEL